MGPLSANLRDVEGFNISDAGRLQAVHHFSWDTNDGANLSSARENCFARGCAMRGIPQLKIPEILGEESNGTDKKGEKRENSVPLLAIPARVHLL